MSSESSSSSSSPTPRLIGRVIAGLMVGFFVTLLIIALWFRRGGAPLLTAAELTAARAHWQAANIQNYDLAIDIRGRREGQVELQVRKGEVTHMTRDGETPARRDTWDVWTVPGMLDTIEDEWSKRDNTAQGFGAEAGGALLQRAKFDPQNGVPLYYSRTISGTPLDVTWQVTLFRPVAE